MDYSNKKIEIEFRARFDEEKYNNLNKFLDNQAKDLGDDNKDVFFFLLPDKLLKVVNNLSRKEAQIVFKLNKIGQGSNFEEIEIPIKQEDFEKAASIFSDLNVADSMRSFQKRHNYEYKGVELALKWSEHWGHHLELEILIDDLSKKEEAEQKIFLVAAELGVSIMSDEDLQKFTQEAEANYKVKK